MMNEKQYHLIFTYTKHMLNISVNTREHEKFKKGS